jgi:hypothetical protein
VSTLAYVRERISVWVGASGNAQVERTLEAIASGNWCDRTCRRRRRPIRERQAWRLFPRHQEQAEGFG